MAGIGDYVHARLFRLQKYGLSTGPDTKDIVVDHSDFISNLVKQDNWVATPALKEKAKALEQIYNLKKFDGRSLIKDEQQFDEMNKVILDAIEKQFSEYVGKIRVTREGKCELDVDSDVYKPLQIGAINDQLAYNTIEKLIELGNKIDTLQRALKSDGQVKDQAGEKALYTLKELERDKTKLLKVFKTWFGQINKYAGWFKVRDYLQNAKISIGGHEKTLKEALNTYSMRGKGTNQSAAEGRRAPIINDKGNATRDRVSDDMIKDCNELIAKYAKYTPLSQIQGLYNELYAKMMPELIQNNANKITKSLLKKLGGAMFTHVATTSSETPLLYCIADCVGEDGNDVKISDFQKEVQTAIIKAGVKTSIDNYSSTSKADVVMTWESKINAGISVKSMSNNSDGYKYIKLVDGTNLLYYMGNWEVPFANTFLNLFATHVDDKNTSRVNYFKKAKQTVSYFAVQAIVTQALTGYNIGRESSHMAQLFAYRNVDSGKWTVVPTTMIIGRIIKHMNETGYLNTEGKLGLKVDIGGNNISNLKLNNAWVGNIYEPNYTQATTRLATLIADAHSKKIYVSMQFSKYVGEIKI